ncbi:MAG: response regulator [Verrucomicrobiota bacterium]
MNKARILVVDDDPRLSALVKKILEGTTLYEVQEENRSYNVLSAARNFMPDAIVLDVDMPGKDGGEVARDIRNDAVLRDTPILFLTALIAKSDSESKVIERGGNHYMAKPVDPVLLKECLGYLIKPGNPKPVQTG